MRAGKTAGQAPFATGSRIATHSPQGEALKAALALADRVQAHSRDAVHVTKQIVQATRGLDDHTAYTVQDPLSAPVFTTAAATEGSHAFTEKRPPA